MLGAEMPFPSNSGQLFNRAAIEAIKPNQYGCYGLYRQNAWIYVGKGDIRTRLLDHLGGGNPCITKEAPTGFITMVTADMDNQEKNLIVELNPICNRKAG
jgi:hypothetical protein